MSERPLYVVILAGGTGHRLWPLSRKARPKQFLAFEDNKNLLQLTLERIAPLTSTERRWAVTTQAHSQELLDHQYEIGNVINEPCARNTAAAISSTCVLIEQECPEARVLFVPADHYIPQHDWTQFTDTIKTGISPDQLRDELVLFGIKPSCPHTGYGYIEYMQQTNGSRLVAFHEKPSRQRAQELLTHSVLWNSGMFGGTVQTFLQTIASVAPDLHRAVRTYHAGHCSYEDIPSISFDHAVMEKVHDARVVPLPITWYDVGSIEQFVQLQQGYQTKSRKANVICHNASNNLVHAPNSLVALVGVDDLCIVQTKDALLIVKRTEQESVRVIVQQLQAKKWEPYL